MTLNMHITIKYKNYTKFHLSFFNVSTDGTVTTKDHLKLLKAAESFITFKTSEFQKFSSDLKHLKERSKNILTL